MHHKRQSFLVLIFFHKNNDIQSFSVLYCLLHMCHTYRNTTSLFQSITMNALQDQQFIEVYREYAPQIFKYCFFRVRRREDAEDIASQTFLKTWEYLAKGNSLDNMRAFLYRVAHNLIIDHYKGEGKKELREISIHNFADEDIEIPYDD